MPANLPLAARAAWEKFSIELEKMGVLTSADAVALETLARTYAECRKLRALIDRQGMVIDRVGSQGYKQLTAHPAMALMQDAEKRLVALLGLFGLSPASRSRVNTVIPKRVHEAAAKSDNAPSPAPAPAAGPTGNVSRFFRRA